MDTTIDWKSTGSSVLINPRTPSALKNELLKGIGSLKKYSSHVWLATSGSSGFLKWVALSKKGILCSAEAVNEHLQVEKKDVFLNCLPTFHVGGIGILARAYIAGAPLVSYSSKKGQWDISDFVRQVDAAKATITSMVVAQIYDAVHFKVTAPCSLRAIVVGGGVLSKGLYQEARKLGWNVLPSYGMTECASQVATAPLSSLKRKAFPLYVPLKHVEWCLSEEGYLKLKSSSLLTAYALRKNDGRIEIIDPKQDGWFVTEDVPKISRGKIVEVQRGENFVKICGESVDLSRLDSVLERLRLQRGIHEDMALVPLEDSRRGCVIHLAVVYGGVGNVETLIHDFNKEVYPYEKIQGVNYLSEIPRSPLKKVLRKQLIEIIRELEF